MPAFTLIDTELGTHHAGLAASAPARPTVTTDVEASVDDGTVRVEAAVLQQAFGWSLRDEGLCRGDRCVPVLGGAPLGDEGAVDLQRFADLLGRPLALDLDERIALLGTGATDRGAALDDLEAPDFALPDLEGRIHTLSEHRGKKVLLIAYASW